MRFFLLLCLSLSLYAVVDINRASQKELETLKGIGETTARRIIDFRAEYCFNNINELTKIKGIGQKRFEAIQNDINASKCED